MAHAHQYVQYDHEAARLGSKKYMQMYASGIHLHIFFRSVCSKNYVACTTLMIILQ